jgi:hypothetical protein
MRIRELLPRKSKPKQKRRHVQTEARLAQQAKFLKRGGKSCGGRPRQNIEIVAAIRENGDWLLGILFELARKEHLDASDKIRWLVVNSLVDRGFGCAPRTLAAAIQCSSSLDGTVLEGATMSPLLAQAHAYAANEARQPRSPDAAQAIEVTAEPTPPQQPFIADPACDITAAPMASSAGSAAHDAAEPLEEPQEAQEAPKRPFGVPAADAADFLARKQRERDQEAERARKVEEARAQGRIQISREEAFPPDPREGPEVVRFTLAPGGRIRRVAG